MRIEINKDMVLDGVDFEDSPLGSYIRLCRPPGDSRYPRVSEIFGSPDELTSELMEKLAQRTGSRARLTIVVVIDERPAETP